MSSASNGTELRPPKTGYALIAEVRGTTVRYDSYALTTRLL
jgi:hypothetical protein